jgi:Holliday junction resolvase
MSELDYTRRLCSGLRRKGVFTQRIEDMYSTGIPDLFIERNGKTIFIEVKFSSKQVVRSRKIGLRPSQVVWLHKHAKAKGRALIIDKAGDTLRVFKGEDSTQLAYSLKKDELDDIAVATVIGGNSVDAVLATIDMLFTDNV